MDGRELPLPDLLRDAGMLKRFDITRVGDLTGLDTLDVPVWFAARPNSHALSVSQGKGTTHEQAATAAVMEAIETAVAERPRDHIGRFGSLAEMEAEQARLVPLDQLARCHVASFDRDRERAWVDGIELRSGEAVRAPFELIGMDMRSTMPWDFDAFTVSSQGLGAGFSAEAAAVHALLELVENDASAASDMFTPEPPFLTPLAYRPGFHDGLDALVHCVEAAGVAVSFHAMTSPLGLPVIGASLERIVNGAAGPQLRRPAGQACRHDPWEAAKAALLEAIQSRLTDIAGSRDDLTDDRYRYSVSPARSVAGRIFLDEYAAGWCKPSAATPAQRLRQTVDALAEAGFAETFLFRLKTGVEGLHVVRILVPGLGAATGDANVVGGADIGRFMALLESAA